MQRRPARDEALERPARESEEPQLLARGRIDGEPERIVGIALRRANFRCVAIQPDRTLTQQPMRREPRTAEHDRCPPREAEEDHGGRDSTDHLRHAAGNEVHGDAERRPHHAEVEVARGGQVAGELGILEMSDTGRTDARFGESIVEPRSRAVAEVRADRGVNRRQHLEEHERDGHCGERSGEPAATLHRRDERTHRDGEYRGQDAAQDERGPPGCREGCGQPWAVRRRTAIPCAA